MKFPREVSLRRLVVDSDGFKCYYNNLLGKTDQYMSIYAFRVPKVYETAIVDKLVIDVDGFSGSGKNTKKAFENARKISEFLDKKKIKHTIVFSGNGFHFYVFVKEAVGEAVKNSLRDMYYLILKKSGVVEDDTHLAGNLAGIIRIPNTFNFKASRWAIFVPDKDLLYNGNTLLNFSKKGVFFAPRFWGKKEIKLKTDSLRKNKRERERSNGLPVSDFTITLDDLKFYNFGECVKRILEKPNPAHIERYFLTVELCEVLTCGRTSDDLTDEEKQKLVDSLVSFYSQLGWDDYNERITRYQVEYIVNRYHHIGLSWRIKHGICVRCGRCIGK